MRSQRSARGKHCHSRPAAPVSPGVRSARRGQETPLIPADLYQGRCLMSFANALFTLIGRGTSSQRTARRSCRNRTLCVEYMEERCMPAYHPITIPGEPLDFRPLRRLVPVEVPSAIVSPSPGFLPAGEMEVVTFPDMPSPCREPGGQIECANMRVLPPLREIVVGLDPSDPRDPPPGLPPLERLDYTPPGHKRA